MKVTIIGAGNSGLAMAAHLSYEGNTVALWNRSEKNISKLIKTHIIKSTGIINEDISIALITSDLKEAIKDSEVILITTPANSHRFLAIELAKNLEKDTLIVLNPGRTFGALEFLDTFREYNKDVNPCIAETQTIIYTCRKVAEDSTNIIALKYNVLISTFNSDKNKEIIEKLPKCIRNHFIAANSIIQTSIGNVGMILHCAPLLLNAGWTESEKNPYKYYYEGITPSVGNLLEKIDRERVVISETLGNRVESTKEWLERIYNVKGNNIYECIQNNEAYTTIDAPKTLQHRYILEDIPCGLVALESLGINNSIETPHTSMIIDLASSILDIDFRKIGRNIKNYKNVDEEITNYLIT